MFLLPISKFAEECPQVCGFQLTRVHGVVVLQHHVNVVKDDTVEIVQFHGFPESDVHHLAFVEDISGQLKCAQQQRHDVAINLTVLKSAGSFWLPSVFASLLTATSLQ